MSAPIGWRRQGSSANTRSPQLQWCVSIGMGWCCCVVGIVSIDDLLPALAKDLGALAELVSAQPGHEGRAAA